MNLGSARVGGRTDFAITILNVERQAQRHAKIHPAVGDAVDLGRFEDGAFDVVFSNSVIEHLAALENQRLMACEVQRVGKAFWIQTPNFFVSNDAALPVPRVAVDAGARASGPSTAQAVRMARRIIPGPRAGPEARRGSAPAHGQRAEIHLPRRNTSRGEIL